MAAIGIVLMSVVAAVAYGVIHDQVTIRLCPEYFTVFHMRVWPGEVSLTLLAATWGVIATWWVGAFLGLMLAIAARGGRRPKLGMRDLAGPIGRMMVVVGLLALVCGAIGYGAAARGWVGMVEPWKSRIPAERHVGFLADLWAHNASYAFGFLGGLVLCRWAWRKRGRLQADVRGGVYG